MEKGTLNFRHLSAGFTTILVGYSSSAAIIIQAATASGANAEQISSWFLALGLAMGFTTIGFSWFYKTPLITAWSTPGAAMLAVTAGDYSLANITGACIFSGLLITLTGLFSPLSKLIEKIPSPLATAMLAAILLPFCLKAFTPVTTSPVAFMAMFSGFILVKRFYPPLAMSALLVIGVICSLANASFDTAMLELHMTKAVLVTPGLDLAAIINIGLPLYILTMLSQNLPGIAVLKSYGYNAPIKPMLITTGITSSFTSVFGGFSLNLAAISAAICMDEHVDNDKSQRYRAAIWAGVFYLVAGIWATTVVALFLSLPKDITQMLAGLALLGTLLMCLKNTFDNDQYRESALFTFLITLSGITFLGLGAILWGLMFGLIHHKIRKV